MVTTAQTASNLNPFNALLCISEHQVQQGFTSGWSIYYLDQEVVLNRLLDCLSLAMPLSQQISGWLKSLIRTRYRKCDTSYI